MIDFPSEADVLAAWCRPLASIQYIDRDESAKKPFEFTLGVTLSSSLTTAESVYRAAYIEEMPMPLHGALSKALAYDLKVTALSAPLWPPVK